MSASAPAGPDRGEDEPGREAVRGRGGGEPMGPHASEGSAGEPGEDEPGVCELCGGPTYERHCKIVCLNCGYRRDCSDP